MFTIELAGIAIGVENRYDFVQKLCRDYLTDREPQFCVSCADEEIARERADSDAVGNPPLPDCYLESVCVYRAICRNLPVYDAILFHAASVKVDGEAYLFTAHSGTGKSTHLRLWKKLLGSRMTVINGDKPIIRLMNGVPTVFGTPWCGKESWGSNTSAPLRAICFLCRGEENRIEPFPKKEAVSRMMSQILMPTDPVQMIRTMDVMEQMLTAADTWLLHCNMEDEAAAVSYSAMSGHSL